MDKISTVQTEVMYEVRYKGSDYTVTSVENLEQGYLDWDVFDDHGNDVLDYSEGLHNEIVAFVVHNS